MTLRNILVTGTTGTGKSVWAAHHHHRWPRLSIFYNVNNVGYVGGAKCSSISRLKLLLGQGIRTVNYVPRTPRDEERINGELEDITTILFDAADRSDRGDGEPPWASVKVDEAHEFGERPPRLRRLTCRGLNAKGVQTVAITQHAAGLWTKIRDCLEARVVYRPGIEGKSFMRGERSYPVDMIEEWTMRDYHFVTFDPDRGWRQHTPVPPP